MKRGMGPLKTLAESYFAELAPMHSRLLFGSDNPYMLRNALEFLDQVSAFSEEQKRDILYNNAAQLFRLQGENR
jgi:predicted TIM-barrel fold metal-dependent hydrolase